MIYHIASVDDWERAKTRGSYTTSTRGRTLAEQGFIHASTAEQVEQVANAFYVGEAGLVLLVIDEEELESEVVYEEVPGADTPFPHIYGPLNVDAVVEVLPFEADSDGVFSFPSS